MGYFTFLPQCHKAAEGGRFMCLDPLDAMALWAFKTWTITMYYTGRSDMFNLLAACLVSRMLQDLERILSRFSQDLVTILWH